WPRSSGAVRGRSLAPRLLASRWAGGAYEPWTDAGSVRHPRPRPRRTQQRLAAHTVLEHPRLVGADAQRDAITDRRDHAGGDGRLPSGTNTLGRAVDPYAASTWAVVGASPATVVRRMSRGWRSS